MVHIALSIIGNKTDLSDDYRQVKMDRGVAFAHSLGAMFTETSAAQNKGKIMLISLIIMISTENLGVKEAFLKVAQGIIELSGNNLCFSRPETSVRPFSDTVFLQSATDTHDTHVYTTNAIGKTYRHCLNINVISRW